MRQISAMRSPAALLRAVAPVALAIGLLGVSAGPVGAFCVRNVSRMPVEVRLQNINPLAGFSKVLRTGQRTCCDWLYRNCNPMGGRGTRLLLSVRGWGQQYHDFYCSGPIPQRTMIVSDGEVTVFDDAGQLGALRCDSRDFYGGDVQSLRPSAPPGRARPVQRTRPRTSPGTP